MNLDYALEEFQELGVNNIISKTKEGSVLAVSPGGSGKGVLIATVAYRFAKNIGKHVLILVHTGELLAQIRTHLLNWYSEISQKIDSKTEHIDSNARIFVGMVETFDRRASKTSFMSYFKNIGLLMFDEAHLSNFNKIIIHFPTATRIGWTATPISAVKDEPLNKYYKSIVIVSKPSALIELNETKPDRGIVPCEAWSLGDVDRSKFKVKGKDFDEDSVGSEFKKPKQIQNTINAIIKHAYNKKIVIFNANIESSIEMHEALIKEGFNSRHLNGKSPKPEYKKYSGDEYRKDCFRWLKETPNAILNNVGIATTGFDEPSIECVILNSSTMSLTLHIQKMVRVSRPYTYIDGKRKEVGLVLDMGKNIPFDGGNLKDYNFDWDWEYIFNNPKKKIEGGVGMVKSCVVCGGLNPISARYCTCKVLDWLSDDSIECGNQFPIEEAKEDLVPKEMVRVSEGINVSKCIEFFVDKTEFYSYFQLFKQIAIKAKTEMTSAYLDTKDLDDLLNVTHEKCSEWYKLKARKRPPNFKHDLKFKMIKELQDVGFIITPEEIELFTNKEILV